MDKIFMFEASNDLSLIQIGQQKCESGHHYSCFLQDSYLIHFILSGKGIYRCGDTEYGLCAGNAFLIMPHSVNFYRADDGDPWHYCWFQFSGNIAKKFLDTLCLDAENPIYTARDPGKIYSAFCRLLDSAKDGNEFTSVGAFFTLLGEMVSLSAAPLKQKQLSGGEYVTLCKNFVKLNYYRPIEISQLCRIAKIERSYLFRLFKEYTGESPQSYIVNYKLGMAKNLLKSSQLGVSQIAASVGYEDVFAFSKLFKRHFNMSPAQFKKAEKQRQKTEFSE